MPKTNIYPPCPTPDGVANRRVEVGWMGGTVQVATTLLTNPANLTVDDPHAEPEWKSDSYVDLDRQGVNNLIRALRQARDKAYGRDE
jgi:hypothetical protein